MYVQENKENIRGLISLSNLPELDDRIELMLQELKSKTKQVGFDRPQRAKLTTEETISTARANPLHHIDNIIGILNSMSARNQGPPTHRASSRLASASQDKTHHLEASVFEDELREIIKLKLSKYEAKFPEKEYFTCQKNLSADSEVEANRE